MVLMLRLEPLMVVTLSLSYNMSTKRQNSSSQLHKLHTLANTLVKAENKSNKLFVKRQRSKPLSR